MPGESEPKNDEKKPIEAPVETPVEAVEVSKSKESEILSRVLSKTGEDLIPWEKTKLPSMGIYYDGAIPNGEVEVRAWGIQTDKILATQRLAQTGQALDYVIKNCVRLPNEFDHMNLLIGDRVFLLYYLRGITYGNMYEFLVECSDENCPNVWTETYDLNLLSSTIMNPNPAIGDEPFQVTLPYMSKLASKEMDEKIDFWVGVRLLRGYDLAAIMQQRRIGRKIRPTARARARNRAKSIKSSAPSKQELDESVSENLRMVITEVLNDRNSSTIENLVSKMHAADTATVREFLRDNSPGIETSIEVECSECGNNMVMDLPITESFFRPTGPGGIGE